MYKRILVPLDGSAFAEAALIHARTLAACTGAEIALLRVALPPSIENSPARGILMNAAHPDTVKESAAYLERVAAGLRAAGLTVSIETCTGPVAETILDYARDIQADMIAMSTHGRSGLERWFIGSVADKVVRAARLPVLLARPDEID